jgi:hypothetical protein
MPAIWVFIKGLMGNAIMQYVGIGIIGLIAAGVIKHELVAPYARAVTALKSGSDSKDAQIEADTKQRLTDAKAEEIEKAKLNDIIRILSTSACKPDSAQLERLRKL